MKMYILIDEDVPVGFAINSAAHGAIAAHNEFNDLDEVCLDYQEWLANSFKKVTCKVSKAELDKACEAGYFIDVTESALGGQLVARVFAPRPEWPKCFKHFALYK